MCHPEVPAGEVTPEVIREEVEIPLPSGERMPALLSRPDGRSGPAVVIGHDVFGRSPFYEHLSARLATAGFQVLLPDCFFREGPLPERTLDQARIRRNKLNERGTVDDLDTAISWIRARPETSGARTGFVGFCMGGTLALDLTAVRADLASVCYYGFPARLAGHNERSAPAPLDQLDQLRGPILGFWGDQDHGVGMDNVETLARELRSRGTAFEYTIYPGVGHGFLGISNLDPEHEAYDAACASWTRTLSFFRHQLGKSEA